MFKKKFLIIGSNSFCGSHCVKELLLRGFSVYGISRQEEPNDIFLPYKWIDKDIQKNFIFDSINLNNDLEKLLLLIDEHQITHIINFSAQGMVAESWKSPNDWYQTNLISQVAFHDELRKRKNIDKYLHFTTPEVYGDTKNKWVDEDTPFNPSTPYAVSRAACDLHLKSFCEAYNFPVVFTRAANVFGPGQQLYRVIPRTILSCLSGKKFNLHGNGLSERSFIHIEDTINATIEIILNGNYGETYHISTNEVISIRGLVEKICNFLDINFEDIVSHSNERLGKDQSYFLNSNKIRKEFKWSEKYTLDAGIRETIKWIKNNKEITNNLSWEYKHIK